MQGWWGRCVCTGLLQVDMPLEIVSVGPIARTVPRASGVGEGDGCVERCGVMLSFSHMVDPRSGEK